MKSLKVFHKEIYYTLTKRGGGAVPWPRGYAPAVVAFIKKKMRAPGQALGGRTY